MSAARYFLPEGYVSRERPDYFADTETDMVWQPDVYRDVADIARRLGARRLIDFGCGEARKLSALSPEFEILGLDFGRNIELCREHHPNGRWFELDIESEAELPFDAALLDHAVLVCSDVIEHLVRPERLLRRLRDALDRAAALVLSTPEREQTWGLEHRGPPPNPCHVREWSQREFAALLRSFGFSHATVGLTRSNVQHDTLRTILGLCYCDARTQRVASRRPV